LTRYPSTRPSPSLTLLRYIAARGVMNAGAASTALRGPPISMSPESLQGMRQCKQATPHVRDSSNRPIEVSCPALEGVIVQTLAPPEAILLIRKPEKYYDEEEVIVGPFRLGARMRGQRGFQVLLVVLDRKNIVAPPSTICAVIDF
jgi:hypothetical protein